MTGNRAERTTEGHRAHHAKTGCPQLGSSGMKATHSWPVSPPPYHDEAISQRALSLPGALQHKAWLSLPPPADPTLVEG